MTNLFNQSNINQNDPLRLLTDTEIEYNVPRLLIDTEIDDDVPSVLTDIEIDYNVPRLLTDTEIEYILSDIRPIASIFNQSKLEIREHLLKMPITPLGIETLKQEITDRFLALEIKYNSLRDTYAAIKPITSPLNVNAFHKSGSTKGPTYNRGLDRIHELLNASSKAKK